jgi:hypothetical protein
VFFRAPAAIVPNLGTMAAQRSNPLSSQPPGSSSASRRRRRAGSTDIESASVEASIRAADPKQEFIIRIVGSDRSQWVRL